MGNIDVLYLTDNAIDTLGGEQESIKILLNNINKEFSVGIIQPGKLNNKNSDVKYFELTNKMRLKDLIKNPFSFLKYINNVKKVIKQTNPKIIHTQSQASFFIVTFLKKIKLINKNLFIVHTDRGLNSKYNKFINKMFYSGFKRANILVTTTKYNREQWRKELERRKIEIDYKIIENTAGEKFARYDSEKNKTNNYITVSFAGRYAAWKNWPLAYEITNELFERLSNNVKVQMSIATINNKEIREVNEQFAKFRKLMGNNFLGQLNISLDEMNKFYYNSDIFVLTSKENTESFGRTLVEAMSRKNVVLSTNAGGSVEVVNDNNKIFKTSKQFVDKIEYYYNNLEILKQEQEESFEYVNKRYSLDNNIKKHINLYNNILKKENLK